MSDNKNNVEYAKQQTVENLTAALKTALTGFRSLTYAVEMLHKDLQKVEHKCNELETKIKEKEDG